jgi:molecular chaperone GrpE
MYEEERPGAVPPDEPSQPQEAQELRELREQLSAANARADENYNRFLLAAADFENFRKRTERDLHKMLLDRRRSMLERLLPVLDNLERALESSGDEQALRGGLEQTLRGFRAVLAGEGVKPIDVEGKAFDPRVAEAIETTPATDGVADDTVVRASEKGYTIDEELLRPAKVIVAKREV